MTDFPETPWRRDFDNARDPRTAANALRVQPGVHTVPLSGGAATVAGAYVEFTEIADPAAPATNIGRLYVRDSGGKSQLVIRFNTGIVQVIATEP